MKKTRRMYRLRKLGLFIFLKLPAPAPKKTAAPKTRKLYQERKPVLFYEKGDLNVIEAKQQRDITIEDAAPFDGIATRDASDGWTEFDDNPELYVAAVCVLPTNDGPRKKLYRMMVKPSVMKRKRAQFRRKMRQIDQSIAKVAKQEARLTLFLMGKF